MILDSSMLEKKQRTRGDGVGVSGGLSVGVGGGVGWKRNHPVGWGKVSQKAVPSVAPSFSTFFDNQGGYVD